MNPLFFLVFVAFLDPRYLATAQDELCMSPVSGATRRALHACPGQIIKILCTARAGQADEMVVADCYSVNIGGKKQTELTGEHLVLKVEKNTTVDDDEETHLTAQLQFLTECSSTAETIADMFNFLVNKNGREFDPCEYLDSAFMVCALATGLVVVQLVIFYLIKYAPYLPIED